jgi:cytoskeletal protein RodZ
MVGQQPLELFILGSNPSSPALALSDIMNPMKKASGYIITVLILIAILILVFVFITRFFGSKNSALINQQTSTSNVESAVETEKPATQTSGAVTSSKITLTVTSPANGANLDSTNVTVKGKTSPNADVFVNDVSGKADASGNFAVSIGLDEGSNQIVVSANDSLGNATQTELTVNVASFE